MSEIRDVERIAGDISVLDQIGAIVSDSETFTASLAIPEFINQFFDGDYSVTPSAETQVLQTKDLVMRQDLTINPIPNNYGLITWNGAYLTVS